MSDHVHINQYESVARMGVAPMVGIMYGLGPFLLIGYAIFVVCAIAVFSWNAALLPFWTDDVRIAQEIERAGPGCLMLGIALTLSVVYLPCAFIRRVLKRGSLFRPKLALAIVGAYAAATLATSAYAGTHPWGQIAFVKANPGRNALRTWNCAAVAKAGKAGERGYYDYSECKLYLTKAELSSACWELFRHMRPLTLTEEVGCYLVAVEQTGHTWPDELPYQEWDRSGPKPYRHPPLATPEKMRAILAAKGLTPL